MSDKDKSAPEALNDADLDGAAGGAVATFDDMIRLDGKGGQNMNTADKFRTVDSLGSTTDFDTTRVPISGVSLKRDF